jgi:signal peptidase II
VKKKLLIVGLVILLILTLDQILKIWVKTSIKENDEPIKLLGSWLQMRYIENQGMAFGTTFGASIWAKLALSLFRIGAIIGLAIYWYKQAKKQVKLEFLIAVGLIFAGATGNLIDSMFYDFIFKFDPCLSFNELQGSGIKAQCTNFFGFKEEIEIRHSGFLFGNVVDMFQFNLTWPSWVPWLGGGDVFPAIWNIADASISSGVIMILIRQRKYFPKEKASKTKLENQEETETNSIEDSTN